MNLSKIRLITFDVTGTLLKLRTAPGQQYGEVGAMYGIVADNNTLITNFKEQFKRMSLEHPNFGLKTGLGWQNWWKNVAKETFRSSQIGSDDKKLDAMAEHLIEMYKTTACWQPCYGVPGILSFIRSKSIPTGVVSNFDPRLTTILTNNKLKHYLDFVVTSYEVGIEKPDSRIFHQALELVGKNVDPESCLHVGNNPDLDYMGARKCGWQAVLISDKSSENLKEKYPDVDQKHVFSSLYQLHMHLLENCGDKLPTSDANSL